MMTIVIHNVEQHIHHLLFYFFIFLVEGRKQPSLSFENILMYEYYYVQFFAIFTSIFFSFTHGKDTIQIKYIFSVSL